MRSRATCLSTKPPWPAEASEETPEKVDQSESGEEDKQTLYERGAMIGEEKCE